MKVNLACCRVMAGEEKGKEKVYGRVKCSEKLTFKELCKSVSKLSAATKGDVELVISSLLEKMEEHLSLGNIVQLGALGNFRLIAGSRGADSEEEFHVSMMKKPRIVFSPGEQLRDAMKRVYFEYVPVKVKEVDEDCFLPHE